MRRVFRLSVAVGLLLTGMTAIAASTLTPQQAAEAVGSHATVCGVVASAHYAMRSRGEPTFLNLGKPYPNQIFTALIWGSDRSKFKTPPESLEGADICVTGLVKSYRGTPEIILRSPSQVRKVHGH